ncbi:ribosomal rRNA-processing protein 9 [Trypanosoma rangeli]|uniref:Ribosomal rRNA-processing protein 9 n=1 Tax=Trypanosoma rangeli TaxID=5698 RepID=A0A3S5IQN4_TRYRA|nr:ribosomal rRNA-processing protein 9 [Trypanosoma rangeli]RNF01342.1 ribosomal rRNA-processing protein 9 [Trypanosoma rangeli]|eukprot:RNF01342.1 ribosomal rRNA-processing protein 9 [Trypanosoma rangeli]
MLAKKRAERRNAIAATASAQRKRELKQLRGKAAGAKADGTERPGRVGKRQRTSNEAEDHAVDAAVALVENPADMLRAIGDHVNTRLQELEFDDDLDADLFDEQQRQLREEAAIAAGTKSRVLSTSIAKFLRRQEETVADDAGSAVTASAKMVRIRHNSNAVTAVCGLGADLVVLGDKSGAIYMAELNGGPSPPLSPNSSQKMLLSPFLPAAVLSIAVSDTRDVRPSQRALFERSTVDTSVTSYIAAGAADGTISVWVTSTRKHMGFLSMHRSAVTGLAFRHDTLYSCSNDETLRVWSVPQMICQDKLFGHQGRVLGIHCLKRERCATVGEDGTMRFWKVDAATQQEFATSSHFGVKVVLECVTMVNDNVVLCGAANGALLLFDVNRRKPLAVQEAAHGYGFVGDGTGLEKAVVAAQQEQASDASEQAREVRRQNANPITSVASIPHADVAASASYDGNVRLWRIVTPEVGRKSAATADHTECVAATATTFECLASIPVGAIVTSLFFTPSGDALLVGCSKEPRLGRWVVQRSALNAAYVIPLDDARLRASASCAAVEHIPALLYGFDDEEAGSDKEGENDVAGSEDPMDGESAPQANDGSDDGSNGENGLFTLGEDGQMQFSAPAEADVAGKKMALRKKKKKIEAKRESKASTHGAGDGNDKKGRPARVTKLTRATEQQQQQQPAGEPPKKLKKKKGANFKVVKK